MEVFRSDKYRLYKPEYPVRMQELWKVMDDLRAVTGQVDRILASSASSTPTPGIESFPVGSVFISIDSTDPAISLGYGTWTQFAMGRVLVGQDPTDVDFDVSEETGGSKTHQIKCNELPDCNDQDPYDDLFLLMGA